MIRSVIYYSLLCIIVAGIAQASVVPETRGMKVRFDDSTTPTEVRLYIDTLYNSGFNLIVLETHYHGYTIYPSSVQKEYDLPEQRPAFTGWDPLKETIEAAHKKNIAVYAWVQTLYIGNDRVEGKGPVLERYPQWAALDQDGNMTPMSGEEGYYFLSPFVEDVCEYLVALYTELVSAYAIDGIFIDYLRYPVNAQRGPSIYDFNPSAVATSKAKLGHSPNESLAAGTESDLFLSWTRLRIEKIHETMRMLSTALRSAREDVRIVANVHGGYSPDQKSQDRLRDWVAWESEGLIDELSTQNYTDDIEEAHSIIRTDLDHLSIQALLLPAITIRDIERGSTLLAAVRSISVTGIVYFVRSRMTPGLYQILRSGPFRYDAYLPTQEPQRAVIQLLNTCIDTMNLRDILGLLDSENVTFNRIRETRMYLESLPATDDKFIRDLDLARRLEKLL
jgi:uncharacterized lipoprotein YddW (UPF0748 family)